MSIISDRIPDWSSLRQFGENKLLRTAYFWMVFTPIAAKTLEHLPESLSLLFQGHVISITLGLPFKWTLFFFGSVFASVANGIYAFKCPKIVKNYDDYASFSDEGRGTENIKSSLLQTVLMHFKIDDNQAVLNAQHFRSTYGKDANSPINVNSSMPERAHAIAIVSRTNVDDSKSNEAFWYVRDLASGMSVWWRGACFLFFLISFALFGYVLIQNIAYVGKIFLQQSGVL